MKITFERALEVLEAMGYELEQPEQEPVAWWHPKMGAYDNNYFDAMQPLYLSPVRTKDLTDDELIDALTKTLVVDDERFDFQGGRILTIRELELLPTARAIIAADREKNK